MKDLKTTITKIVKTGKSLYENAKPDKEFRLSLDTFPVGNLIGRHLLAVGYTLSFIDEHNYLKGLIGLPYYDKNKQIVLDAGIPDTDAINYAIDLIADICKIKVNEAYYLKDDEVKVAYNIAKTKAKGTAKTYKAYSGYTDADKFEIGELDA